MYPRLYTMIRKLIQEIAVASTAVRGSTRTPPVSAGFNPGTQVAFCPPIVLISRILPVREYGVLSDKTRSEVENSAAMRLVTTATAFLALPPTPAARTL